MATVFIRTKQAGFQLTPADCVEFSQLYMRLGRARQAARWEEEATRYQSLKNR
jgi:hypothetical protein